MNKKISIIVPVYNVENYVEECIMSILKQTYKNIEIILVNDGSTDSSYDICSQYAKIDKRIKLYTKKNGGLSDARNYGVKHATGNYIFFLDSDDLIQEDALELMVNELQTEKSIVVCNFENFVDEYNYSSTKNVSKFTPVKYFEEILKLNTSTYACGVLMPRSFIKNDLFIKGRYFEDLSSMYKIFSQCDTIYKIDCGLYKYRTNPNSIVHTVNQKKVNDYQTSAYEMIDFINDKYKISKKILNTYKCEILRSCYIMTGEDKYLEEAKRLSKNVSFEGLSFKNKLKIYLLRSKMMTKVFVKIKNN